MVIHYLGKPKSGSIKVDCRPHATVVDWNALKEQFKQQFNPVGNTREEQMASLRNIKWDGNETLDEFSYRVTQLGMALGLYDQHILDTFKLRLPSNMYGNLVHIDGMQATLNMAKRHMAVSKGTSPGASAISNIPFMVAMMGWLQVFIKNLTYPNK